MSIGPASAMCHECMTNCTSLQNCLKQQEFNLIVENAQAIAKLKKHIKTTVPHFKGIKKWLTNDVNDIFENVPFSDTTPVYSRFITITFDPKKFTFNELTQPTKLDNYLKNALNDLRNLFKENPIVILEFHKSGINHYHINYECNTVLEHNTLILRLRYYFSDSLRNRNAIHDRMFNDNGKTYLRKSNNTYFTFKN